MVPPLSAPADPSGRGSDRSRSPNLEQYRNPTSRPWYRSRFGENLGQNSPKSEQYHRWIRRAWYCSNFGERHRAPTDRAHENQRTRARRQVGCTKNPNDTKAQPMLRGIARLFSCALDPKPPREQLAPARGGRAPERKVLPRVSDPAGGTAMNRDPIECRSRGQRRDGAVARPAAAGEEASR